MTNELKTYSAHIFELGCMNQQVYLKSEADKELRYQKYKRCLAMAKWCEERYHYLTCLENWRLTDKEYQQVIGDYWDRWYKRWLKIAEKFKEAENGNSKRAD